jgi:membrane protein implicated in regulation of membrane protease activity
MALVYLFALVVALGVLLLQVLMGGRGGGHHGEFGHAVHVHAGGDHAGGAHGHAHGQKPGADQGETAFWTLFLSFRFWIFAALGFGLSGSLLHLFALAHPIATLFIASGAGLASGLFASMAFRTLRRGSAGTEARSSVAVGKVGRVVVPCGKGLTGQIRVELAGSSVDLMATTDDDSISKGEAVLVEDLREGVAHVSRRPSELG